MNMCKIEKTNGKWSLLMAVFVLLSCSKAELDTFGNVSGIVTDAKSGEPVRAASVTLNPGGLKTTTGSDGRYEYNEIEAGQYTLQVMRDGYQTAVSPVTLQAGVTKTVDIPLITGQSSLAVNKSTLDLGTNTNLATFTILNTGSNDLTWQIEYDCEWIESINPRTGTTKAKESTSVSVKIDRAKLTEKKVYSYSFVIISSGGSAEVTVSASNEEGKNDEPGNDEPASTVTNGLYVYYIFENNSKNTTETALNAITINEVVYESRSADGSTSIKFNRAQKNYINIPEGLLDEGKFSISFWVKGIADGHIFHVETNESAPNNKAFVLYMQDGKLIFVVKNNLFVYERGDYGGVIQPFSHGTITDNKWHMLTLTSNSGYDYVADWITKTRLYIDGDYTDVVTEEATGWPYGRGLKFILGGEVQKGYNSTIAGISMNVDNLRIYNTRVLSDVEVKQIYEAEGGQ
jgi:hypothetical protein